MPGLGRAWDALPVCLSPVCDPNGGDDANPVADCIEDAVMAEPNAVGVGCTGEFEVALRAWVRSEAGNKRCGALPVLECGKCLEFLGRRRFNGDAIAFHGA